MCVYETFIRLTNCDKILLNGSIVIVCESFSRLGTWEIFLKVVSYRFASKLSRVSLAVGHTLHGLLLGLLELLVQSFPLNAVSHRFTEVIVFQYIAHISSYSAANTVTSHCPCFLNVIISI